MQHEVLGRSNGKNDVRTKEGHRIALTDEELAVFEATGKLPELTPLSMLAPEPIAGLGAIVKAAVDSALNEIFKPLEELTGGTFLEGTSFEARIAAIEAHLGIVPPAPAAPAKVEQPSEDEARKAKIEARHAELIGLPMPTLKQVADGHGIPSPVGTSKADLAKLVIDKEFTS